MSAVIGLCVSGLLCILITSVSPGAVYVRSGADITGCDMTCPQDDVTLELYRHCGGEEKSLMELHCLSNFTKSHDPRLHLDTRSGCWKLTPARKNDSCVYKIWCFCESQYLVSTTDIHVLDPILISNITSNCSRLGQDIAVSVQYSGEESVVTWEVDGEPLPERYRLIDGNRTLIIPSVQRDDTKRIFRVRITNPVSEEPQDYRLEIRDPDPYRGRWGLIGVLAVPMMVVISIILVICWWKKGQRDPKTLSLNERNGCVHTMDDGPDHLNEQENGSGPTKAQENGSGPTKAQENGPGPTKAQENGPGPTKAQENGSGPTKAQENGSGPTKAQENGSGPTKGNGHEVHISVVAGGGGHGGDLHTAINLL